MDNTVKATFDFEGIVCSELMVCWREIVQRGKLTRWERNQVPEPIISLTDSESFLGRWESSGNVISIKRKLVHEHPWYAVLDVFYHEVAHQITHYLYPNANETAHGPLFRQICERIGASPAASASLHELDERLFASKGDDSLDPMVDKIRKLLTLAEKGDEHEAEVAYAKAIEIMDKYGIDEGAIEDEGFVTISVGKPSRTVSSEDSFMLGFLTDFFSVKAICSYVKNLENGTEERIRMICGTPVHVKIASYVYDSIQSHIDLAWEKYCAENRINRKLVRRKRDFAMGVIISLRNKLNNNKQLSETRALVHVGDAALENFFHSRFPSIRTITHHTKHNKDAVEAGRAAGENIELHDGVGDGNPGSRLLKG
ncbi:MAG: DUF2786 domain-containing protein [Victivallales bacterium]|nr:DUF2786 domain-containing protein [Victivallales bacterium]